MIDREREGGREREKVRWRVKYHASEPCGLHAVEVALVQEWEHAALFHNQPSEPRFTVQHEYSGLGLHCTT